MVLELRKPEINNLAIHVKDAITKTSRGICNKFQIRRPSPVGVGYDGMTIPGGKILEPPSNVVTGFAVHGDEGGMLWWRVE